MGFSLKRTVSGAVKAATVGTVNLGGGSVFRGPSLSRAAKGWGNFASGGAIKDMFGDVVDPASPEAAELKRIKLAAGRGEGKVLEHYKRRSKDSDKIAKGDIEREDRGLAKQQKSAEEGATQSVRGAGMQNTSQGLLAESGTSKGASEARLLNKASFERRKDDIAKEYGNMARQTLNTTDIGTKFHATTKDSFGKSLLRGGVTSFTGGLAKGLGQKAGGS